MSAWSRSTDSEETWISLFFSSIIEFKCPETLQKYKSISNVNNEGALYDIT